MPEAERLDEQTELLNQNIGYLLHPSIASKLQVAPTIADIGTGTGFFLVQLSELYPGASLYGFDISPALYPSTETLPSNIHLDVMDIRQPPPLSEHKKYDLVHVRLIVAGIKPSEWEVVVSNIVQLLKPGGAIQWEECNFAAVQHLRGGVMSSVHTARDMGGRFREALKDMFSHGWNILPQLFEGAGLEDVENDIVSSDRVAETRKAFTRNGMQAIFGWARLISSRNAPGSSPMDEIDRLEREAERDIESGCYVRFDIHVALGFKAK